MRRHKRKLVISLLALLNAMAYAEYDAIIYPVIKGTTVPDRSKPMAVVRDGVAYQVIKGTTVPDISKPAWRTYEESESRHDRDD